MENQKKMSAEIEVKEAEIEVKENEGVTRRTFIGSLVGSWVFLVTALAGIGAATIRFMYPNVHFDPPTRFKAGFPDDYPMGVSTRFQKANRVWIVREETGFFALYAKCTHLGCTPAWLEAEKKFKCPCHGSGYHMTGVNFEGPTPRPLERVYIGLAEDGQLEIDTVKHYVLWEEKGLNQWQDDGAYLLI